MLLKKCFAELIGTFALVFAGCGAIIANELTGGAVSHVGVALAFGITVMAMIYAVGELSGAHLNPAVSFGFWVSGRLPASQMAAYWGVQCGGAILAALVLRFVFPQSPVLGATLPAAAVTVAAAFLYEIILTFFLAFVILRVATGSKEQGLMAGIAIGGTVAFDALFGGPITGASMNPARSLGPALVSGTFDYLWLYLLAPMIGALVAVGVHKALFVAPYDEPKTETPAP